MRTMPALLVHKVTDSTPQHTTITEDGLNELEKKSGGYHFNNIWLERKTATYEAL